MKLQALSIENFRGFSRLAMEFRPDRTVLTGGNGSGKSAVLDAVALALAAYTGGFSGVPASGIAPSDVRLERSGTDAAYRAAGPLRVAARVEVSGHPLAWSRTLEGGRTVSADAGELLQYAAALEEHIRRHAAITLPVIAHYGADRCWLPSREPSALQKVWIKNRQSGYIDCLHASDGARMLLSWFETMTYAKQQKSPASDDAVPGLYAVTQAMSACYLRAFPFVKQVSFSFDVVQGDLELLQTLEDGRTERLPLRLLGQGVKNTLLLVADIACRMAVLNPHLGADVCEQTPGIVLIDEIDLHLHPSWQKHILDDLAHIFPLVQFIVTANSPLLLANTDGKFIRVLRGGQVYRASLQTYGKPVDTVLAEAMKTDPQPEALALAFASFYDSLEQQDMEAAGQKLEWLTECLGADEPAVERAAKALQRAGDES